MRFCVLPTARTRPEEVRKISSGGRLSNSQPSLTLGSREIAQSKLQRKLSLQVELLNELCEGRFISGGDNEQNVANAPDPPALIRQH